MDNGGPGIFEITVRGASGIVWSDWLDDVIVTHRPDAPSVTVLRGPMDQSTLRGVLNRIWDLNLTLISVVPAGTPADVVAAKLSWWEEQTMKAYILSLGSSQADLATVGGKGAALAQMVAAGLPVPDGFHITTQAYRAFVAANGLSDVIGTALDQVDVDTPSSLTAAENAVRKAFVSAPTPPDVAAAIAQAYAGLAGPLPVVAVRSSATAEDLPDLSFAGQQDTYLNISGVDDVLASTKHCWASLWTARAIGYRARHAVSPEKLSLAVVVQLLVPAEVAGVLFTANPMNGRRDQALVNASWGLGEAVVSGLVTPDTFTVEKATGVVIAQEIADKAVMTVRVNGGTEEQPVPDDLRRAPSLNVDQLAALVRRGDEIEALYKSPRDVEFAIADGVIAIVQARPITALPLPTGEPQPRADVEWPMPDPKGQYLRTSIVDLMPDPLLPLYATLGLPTINRTMDVLMAEVFGAPEGVLPSGSLQTINGYAYMSAGYTPKQMLRMLWYMLPKYGKLMRTGIQYWQEGAYPEYKATTTAWERKTPRDLTPDELLDGVRAMADEAMYHLSALMVSTMGPSAGLEGLFTQIYEKIVRREGDPPASALLLGFDNIPLSAEKTLYDLAQWSRAQLGLAPFLLETPSIEIIEFERGGAVPEGVDAEVWREWCRRLQAYVKDYGYAIYYLDFARELPLDNPVPAVETLKLYMTDRAGSPYERQEAFTRRREAARAGILRRIKGLKKWAFEKSLAAAQKRVPLRENGIAEIGLGYPVLRSLLRELGRRFVTAGAIAEDDDVFWMEMAEVVAGVADLARDVALSGPHGAIESRKSEWRHRRNLTPPPMLPPKSKYMGIDVSSFSAESGNVEGSTVTKGVGASPGRVTASACVLHGPEDFDQMQVGSILVASATTPAWTPLFAMASGVVTDIGGPLSHGSIVAREYGIPAVMGTGSATKLIESGQTITVCGDIGEVLLANGNGVAR